MKEKYGSGTGTGTLMPTCPAWISRWYFLAAAPDCVKSEVPEVEAEDATASFVADSAR